MQRPGVPDPAGTFSVTVCSFAGPIAHATVMLDFSNCTDVSICSVQVTPSQQVTCNPAARTITAIADDAGEVTFTLVGGVTHRTSPASTGCLTILGAAPYDISRGFEVLDWSPATAAALAESGGDLSTSDLSLWISDFFSPAYLPRSDFNNGATCGNKLSPTDLAIWLKSYFGGYTLGRSSLGGTPCF
jgi:hypothetical protein